MPTIGFSGTTSRSHTGARSQLRPSVRASRAVSRAARRTASASPSDAMAARGGRPGRTGKLLSRAALEIGGDQEWHTRALAQLLRERAHALLIAAKEDEAAHAKLKRTLDVRARGAVAVVRVPANRGKEQRGVALTRASVCRGCAGRARRWPRGGSRLAARGRAGRERRTPPPPSPRRRRRRRRTARTGSGASAAR